MKIYCIPLTFGSALVMLLLCLSMGFSSLANAAICDVDIDDDVDQRDLKLIIGARNEPAGGPDDPRDADGDGTITVQDARACVKQCNLQRCAIIDPTPPPPSDDAGQSAAPDATSIQNAIIGTEWKVKRGDTLYAIGRAVYPGDAGKQARIRQDIMKLNPSVFANGANNMAVGVVLKLPGYVVLKSVSSKTATHRPASEPDVSTLVVKPESESQAKKEPSTVKGPSSSSTSEAEGNIFVSLGYSLGGDKLVDIDGLYDIDAGAGGQLRLGYDQIYQHGSGYRIALGLQYNLLLDSDEDTSFRDIYWQLAYQYRANQVVYGIGVVLHEGATLEEDSTIEYDAANGVVVYVEDVGSGALAGWGLSYTSLDIEEENDGESFDASRVEFYYSWRF